MITKDFAKYVKGGLIDGLGVEDMNVRLGGGYLDDIRTVVDRLRRRGELRRMYASQSIIEKQQRGRA